ncbi:hypothetical protein BSIN_4767 [Burkholderia singularis]|uniref:Uncharacterized protein n=1 Tax=Burkholderia singularis TaxID=1503053 RepID=A0A238H9V9_9BURK|nr:hypothetical protein BSIN_4767 [Burkholderia singularis]
MPCASSAAARWRDTLRPHIALPQKRRDTPHYLEPPAATMRRATFAPCSSPI